MKLKFAALLLFGIIICSCSRKEITVAGQRVNISCGDNQVNYLMVDDFAGKYRIFGVTMMGGGNGPLNHFTAIMPVIEAEKADEIRAKTGCEAGAVDESRVIAVIAANYDVEKRLSNLESGSFYISGRILKLDKHLFRGENADLRAGGGGVELDKVYWIQSIR